jgi:DNA-binding SARP family transcriptional activator
VTRRARHRIRKIVPGDPRDEPSGTHLQPPVSTLRVQTLGGFRIWRAESELEPSVWGRGKALQLFQFLVTIRRRPLHKEQIIDQLWPELDVEAGDRDFRVALHSIYRALEPERPARAASQFVRRNDLAYGLNVDAMWIDADVLETEIAKGNASLPTHPEEAIEHYGAAAALYAGDYLPERRYEDWTSAERERLETLALGAITTLAELMVERTPLESIRLTERVLAIDPVWEDAYRVQMRAYLAEGNRPLAIRAYQRCVQVLSKEFGIVPLPETRGLYEQVQRIT